MKAWSSAPSGRSIIFAVFFISVLVIGCQRNPLLQTSPTSTAAPAHTSVMPTLTATVEKRIPERRIGHRPYPPYLELSLQRASTGPTSLQMPAAGEATLAGRGVISVTLLAGRYEPGGERRLVSTLPTRVGGFGEAKEEIWSEGVSELSYIWETEGDYLSDGSNGDFVLLKELDPAGEFWTVAGQFRPSDSEEFESVELQINRGSGLVSGIYSQRNAAMMQVGTGDEFQIIDYYLHDSGFMMSRPGKILRFDESGRLAFQRLPLSAGNYFLTYLAISETGSAATLSIDYLVGNENLLPNRRAYFQPEYGYQFLYPEEWFGLDAHTDRVLSTSVVPTMTLQIAIDPVLDASDRSAGQRTILHSFGDVEVLYEDQFEMGLYGGSRTIYGYESSIGSRTGVLLTFSYDGRVFFVDVDGPEDDEQKVASVAQSLIDSWIWRSVPEVRSGRQWRPVAIDGTRIYVPADYQYNMLSNGWHRLSDNQLNAFLAYRLDEQSMSSSYSRLLYWETVASRDVANYVRSEIYDQQLAGIAWRRIDFQYDSEELGEIWGAIMSLASESGEFIAWLEAPASDFMRLEDEQLSLLLANLVRQH